MPQNASRREMRKLLIRLRMEMHRQEIRHESQQLMVPLNKVRNMGQSFQGGLGIKPRFAYTPLRVALTGRRVSPPLFESMEILGKESTLARIAALRASL